MNNWTGFLSRPLVLNASFIGNTGDRGTSQKSSQQNPGCRNFYRANYLLSSTNCMKNQKGKKYIYILRIYRDIFICNVCILSPDLNRAIVNKGHILETIREIWGLGINNIRELSLTFRSNNAIVVFFFLESESLKDPL